MWYLGFRGVDVDMPQGKDGIQSVSEIATLDISNICPECSYGVRQVGPLRVPGAALAKCKRVFCFLGTMSGDVWIDESVVDLLHPQTWTGVELRKIEQTGAIKAPRAWYQILPTHKLDPERFFHKYYQIHRCKTCSRGAWERRRDNIGKAADLWDAPRYYTNDSRAQDTWCFAWYPFVSTKSGQPAIRRAESDGRIVGYPAEGTMLSTLAVEQFKKLKDRRIVPGQYALPLENAADDVKQAYQQLHSDDL